MNKPSLPRKVSMSEIVSPQQTRAAKRVVKKAVIRSIRDQDEMAKLAKGYSS